LRQVGKPVPAPIAVRAAIDTGAEATCLDPSAFVHQVTAGIPPTRFLFANLPAGGGLNVAPEYAVSLTLVHPSGNARANLVLRNHPVLQQPLGQIGYQALVGRDILKASLFVYAGPAQTFPLAY